MSCQVKHFLLSLKQHSKSIKVSDGEVICLNHSFESPKAGCVWGLNETCVLLLLVHREEGSIY